jgi:hypothetical protein
MPARSKRKSSKRPSPASRAAPASPPSPSVPPADQELVQRAYRKLMAREALSKAEQQALTRHEKYKEERLRWQYYHSIPQKHWREMSGRQAKVINEQALRYGLPFGSASIDLPSVVRALHDFLADNAQKLAKDDDLSLGGGGGGGGSPALERYRRERAALARLDRLERQRRVMPREEVRSAMGRVAAVLRGAGEALGRQFGPAAVDLLHEAMDDAQREIDRSFMKDPLSPLEPEHAPGDEHDAICPEDFTDRIAEAVPKGP